jgi:citrate lyase subunit beta/citryl-CoA lyase
MRPRRSALFMPGNNIRAISKSKTLPYDVVILDLEDAVGSDKKR